MYTTHGIVHKSCNRFFFGRIFGLFFTLPKSCFRRCTCPTLLQVVDFVNNLIKVQNFLMKTITSTEINVEWLKIPNDNNIGNKILMFS